MRSLAAALIRAVAPNSPFKFRSNCGKLVITYNEVLDDLAKFIKHII